MRIGSSAIGMESEHYYSSRAGRMTKATVTRGQIGKEQSGGLFSNLLQSGEDGTLMAKEDSNDYLHRTMQEMQEKSESLRSRSLRSTDMSEVQKKLFEIRQQCVNYILDILFPARRGAGSRTGQRESLSAENSQSTVKSSNTTAMNSGNATVFTFSRAYYYEEQEYTSYTSQGTVKCADGREISFNLNMEMSRSFQEYYEENYMSVQANLCDPLVINLDGNIAGLSEQTFFFDIDGDGEVDEINRLREGSGYLSLDRNGDGVINDGSELFGTQSGNGFADLAAYDSDGNGFIDEGDEIWDKLKIWTMDENGNQQLVSLSEKGVGAICLQSAETNYSLTDESNAVKGVIRRTGIFLYENGSAGSIQHLDVAKYDRAG